MSISVEIPGSLLQKIEKLKNKPDEGPIEVINRFVYYYNEMMNYPQEKKQEKLAWKSTKRV